MVIEKVEGKVIRIEGRLILISTRQGDLKRGQVLVVYRLRQDPKYLGQVRIVEVSGQNGVGMVIGKQLGEILPGDQVASQLGEQTTPKRDTKEAILQKRIKDLEDRLATMNREVASLRKELKSPPPPSAQLKTFPLRYLVADEFARSLQLLFRTSATVRVTADARTNSILVYGIAEDLKLLEAILARLDRKAPARKEEK